MQIFALGHCYEPGRHDKIWGILHAKNDSYGAGALVFWGRANGTLTFKRHSSFHDALLVWATKQRKGYQQLGTDRWAAVLPEDFQGQVMLAQLGQVRHDHPENA